MTRPRRLRRAAPRRTASPDITLAHVLAALEPRSDLSPTRLRDLRSAVKRVAALLREDPSVILLDLPAVASKLAAVNPIAAGLTAKSFANIRSDFLAAVKASGFNPVERKS